MIRDYTPPSPDLATFYDGLKYTEFTTACFLSAEREAWVDLPSHRRFTRGSITGGCI